MKKLFLIITTALTIVVAEAQTSTTDKAGKQPKAKKEHKHGKQHVCNAACTNTGSHAYLHKEKGHVCTEECHKKK